MKNECFEWCLEGLNPEQHKIAEKYFDLIDVDYMAQSENEVFQQILPPVIGHIVRTIIDPNEHKDPSIIYEYLTNPFYKEDGVTIEKLLNAIDINEITDSLEDYCENFIPQGVKYLPNLDGQAELTLLFCTNYLIKIFDKKIGRNKKN